MTDILERLRIREMSVGDKEPIYGLAATHIAAQDARMEALEEALRTEIWNGSKQRGMSDNAAMALVKTRIAALGGEQHGG